MNKDISKAIVDRTRLRNKFLRSRSIEDRNAYNNKEITVFHLFVKLKKIITIIWTIRRLLATSLFGNISNHCRRKTNARSNKITLVQDSSILENNDKTAETSITLY